MFNWIFFLLLSVLAGAMKAMVSKDIVHRDLKPQNILLSHNGKTKSPRPEDMKLKIGKLQKAEKRKKRLEFNSYST